LNTCLCASIRKIRTTGEAQNHEEHTKETWLLDDPPLHPLVKGFHRKNEMKGRKEGRKEETKIKVLCGWCSNLSASLFLQKTTCSHYSEKITKKKVFFFQVTSTKPVPVVSMVSFVTLDLAAGLCDREVLRFLWDCSTALVNSAVFCHFSKLSFFISS